MKAIITGVKKSSGFSYLNGRTFEVKEVLSGIVALSIPSLLIKGKFDTCDFSFSEVMIVDIEKEVQWAYDGYNWNGNNLYHKLLEYVKSKGIDEIIVKYNCPA